MGTHPAADSAQSEWPPTLLEIYGSHRLQFVRLAFVITGDREAAEDIVHDSFVAVLRAWAGVQEAKPYLRAAVVNRSRSWLRRRQLERRQPARPETAYEAAPDEVWDALEKLSPRQRVAVILRYYEALPDVEIASILGCREATVRTTIHRALAALRKEIEQ